MSRGHDYERKLKQRLEEEGWVVSRAAGSLGDADLWAAIQPEGSEPGLLDWPRLLFVEVKSNKLGGPYHNFRPEDRRQLSEAARRAGAEAWLVWWLPRREPEWYPESSWPENREKAAT